MKKGLTLTLTTVLMAAFCLNAMAMAPVVSNLKDIVVGDSDGATASNLFVYPEVWDLTTKATDDEGDAIVWSFTDTSDRYLINGVGSATDPIAPGANELGGDAVDPEDGDSNSATITVRDQVLSPIGGPNVDPGAAGIVNPAGSLVTFWASDGDKAGSGSVLIFTDNDGEDRLSGAGAEPHNEIIFTAADQQNWTFKIGPYLLEPGDGESATSNDEVEGLCVVTTAAGNSNGWWQGPYSETDGIAFVSNAVYQVRLSMDNSATGAEIDPLWDITFENTSATVGEAEYVYGGDFWYLAQWGGANSITTTNGIYDIYYAPACVGSSDWETTASANDSANDMRMGFRVADIDGAGYGGADADFGTVCLDQIEVSRIDLDDMTIGTTVWDQTDLSSTNWTVKQQSGTTVSFAGGDITLTPSSDSSWDLELIDVDPGDTNYDPGNTDDNYPLVWEPNKLYVMEVELQAPDAAAEANPVDYINFMVDTASNEMFAESFVTRNMGGVAMPVAGTPTTYYTFFNSVNVTAETTLARLRGHLYVGLSHIEFGRQGARGDSGLIVKGFKISEVEGVIE